MNRYKKTTMAAMAFLAASGMPLTAAMASEDELRREILELKKKVERLEKDQQTVPDAEQSATDWFNNISLSGLVEVEANYTDGSESDITLATVELGIEAQVTSWVNAHVLILFEEDETDPPEIDEGVVTLGNPEVTPCSLAAGRMYVPFGNFESYMISDPLTLEIAETRETALQAGYTAEEFYGSIYLFNGDTKDGGNDRIEHFGLNLGLARDDEAGGFGYDIGLSWINNLADTDSLQDSVTDRDNLADEVSGYSIHTIARSGPFTIIGEYSAASESFDSADLAFDGSGAKPVAFNVEAAYAFELAEKEANFSLAWQGTREALALELPEMRYLAAFSIGIYQNATLAFEYAHDEDYDSDKGGSGEDTDTFTAQLAVEF